MATQKEIALFGAFSLGCTFSNGMKIVHMPPESILEQSVKHVCLGLRGFSYLTYQETIVQDHLTFYLVRVWSCPYCGKLYWHTQENQKMYGEQALMWTRQKKFIELNGFDTRMIPPESFYAVLMYEDTDTQGYMANYDVLDTISTPISNQEYQPQVVNLQDLGQLDNKQKQKEVSSKQEKKDIESSFDSIDW